MKIIGIKTNIGYYITDNIENSSYFNSGLVHLIINGEPAKKSFKANWFVLKDKPEKLDKKLSAEKVNERYELIDKSLSEKFKEVYTKKEVWDYYDDEFYSEFDSIKGLYEYKFEELPARLEPIEFEFTEILDVEVFNEPSKFSYKRAGQWDSEKYPVTNSNVKYDLIGEIVTPEILKHELPCQLTRKETYDIIRAYVKENINPKVAVITSDYNFCFTVKKKIKLVKEHSYQVDINGFSKKKPKYVTKLQKVNEVEVFEMTHEGYKGYTNIEPFQGIGETGLKENIDNYLNHLISVINEPLKYCPCCEGSGVKLDNE